MTDGVVPIVLVTFFGLLAILAITVVTLDARRTRQRLGDSHDELAAANHSVRSLLDGLPDAVLRLDDDGVITSANTRASDLTGRSVESLIGRSFLGFVAADDQDDITDRWRRLRLDDGTSSMSRQMSDVVFELVDLHGTTHLVEATLHRPVPRAADQPSDGLVVILRDVTDRERTSSALDAARQRFQQAFHSAPTGMALVGLRDNRILDANQALADMLDHSRRYLLGRSVREITHPDDLRAAAPERARIELGIDDGYRLEQRFLRRDGNWIWAKTQVAVTPADEAGTVGDGGDLIAITHIEDVTEQRRAVERLSHQATHDALTELPNRASLVARLDEVLGDAGLDEIAVLFIDLDNFKVVNDSLGHRVGDDLLRHVAARFRSVMREGDQLARFGGDEFVVFVDGTSRMSDETGEIRVGPIDPASVAARLRRSVEDVVVLDGHELVVTASIGYATNSEAGMTADDLLRDADVAMYQAKKAGRDRVERFSERSRSESVAALQTAAELRRGLDRGELVPHFQPIVDLATGSVVKFEVLVRWEHPDRGVLTPDRFLPTAEANGMVGEIGEAMLRGALTQLAHWRAVDDAFGAAALSVNLAAQQLGDSLFLPTVRDALGLSGIEADALWFEITETALLTDVNTASSVLRQLRGLGVHLAVDDFGTGYSSLTYLKRFPVESIKIDKSFVDGLGMDADDESIVRAVIELGHSLGLTVTAEGIESPLQRDRLRALGADQGQGYLFGRPAHPRSLRTVEIDA
ncbi:MAG: EAL domain-containing protein [Actinomycetota bacterium]